MSAKVTNNRVTISRVYVESDLDQARLLFLEYAVGLGIDLSFQSFENELRSLPGEYAPPRGFILLARDGDDPCGCVAVRRIEEGVSEMKRLYVRSGYRAIGLGRRLAISAMDAARELGYERMRLDTIGFMKEAIGLYESLGFKPIEPYRHNPFDSALFLEINLE